MLYISACSTTFTDCITCADNNNDDAIGMEECTKCSGATYMKDDKSACLSKFIRSP